MHEMAYTRALLDIVLDEAERQGAHSVRSVSISIGASRDIVDDQFEGLFSYLSRGTVAEGAELILIRIPLVVRCSSCGCVFNLEGHRQEHWYCPDCESRKFKLLSGREFRVDCIEMPVEKTIG